MQPTIASYFQKSAAKEKPKDVEPKKRKARIISSDEDDEVVAASPQVAKTKHSKKLKTDSNGSSNTVSPSASKKLKLDKLKSKSPVKAVDPMSLFGGETNRVEAKKAPKPKDKALKEFEDDEIDQSLMEIDLEQSLVETTVKESDQKNEKHTPSKVKHEKSTPSKEKSNNDKKYTPTKDEKKRDKDDKRTPKSEKHKYDKKSSVEHRRKEDTKHTPTEHKRTSKASKNSPTDEDDNPIKGKKHKQDLDSSVLTDEERHERKRMTAILYQKYKNRSSVLNHGCKEVPKGKPNCLAGLSFLVTGVLESLQRDEANSIVKEYGGKVMSTVGKRLNYLIVGEDAGLKKLAQAEEYNVKILSEDDFLNLIRQKSGIATENGNGTVRDYGEMPSTSPKTKKDFKKGREEEVKIKKEKVDSPKRKSNVEELNNNVSPKKLKREIKEETTFKEHISKIKKEIKDEVTSKDIKEEFPRPPPVTEDMMAWVDKYKPTTVKDIIGQQGPASNVAKLTNWLSKWYINHDGKKKLQKPNPWAKNDDGSFYKAALLSGPPGIGKTTTATLVCKELGFDAVEFNASDTRSKRLLKEEVSELLSNKSLYGYFHGNGQVTKKHVLIMDEVDGMAGNEDRGGIQELIGLIKESSVPIICMCNDRNHQKMRSLVNYCYDLRFNRPQLKQIKGRILSICAKENIKLDSTKLDEIIAATNNDIRQSINHISLLSAGKELNLPSDKVSSNADEKIAQKDLKMGPWDVVRKVFSADEHKNMSFYDKCDLFFHDYSLAPLFVQQNYLIVNPAGPKSEVIQKVANTADSLSLGDLVDKKIRSNSSWALLPTQAIFSSVMPGEYMSGYFTGQINFPGWLGKNSKSSKRCRFAQEIHDHTRIKTSGSRLSVRLDYAPFLLNKIVKPLAEKGLDGVEESLQTLKEYHLLREDIESLIELTTWPGKKSPMDGVDGKVKAALTRAYNKEVLAYSYSATAGVKKKRAEASEEFESLGVDGDEGDIAAADSEDDKDDALENDGLIKAKKKTAASTSKAVAKKTTGKAKANLKSKK
ncbi:replication factor C subunit 1 [Stomoxys calcitrans]|uniref:replication factor C subunit 1 n=1 Tax=Stomoxys calcitrans TaxID=35570 RepID=UPI0027E292D7|nr:replication factor C subunit 1 [Stomoxys calcitrans]